MQNPVLPIIDPQVHHPVRPIIVPQVQNPVRPIIVPQVQHPVRPIIVPQVQHHVLQRQLEHQLQYEDRVNQDFLHRVNQAHNDLHE